MSKLRLESSVKASMLIVRQASLSVALVCCWMMDIVQLSCFVRRDAGGFLVRLRWWTGELGEVDGSLVDVRSVDATASVTAMAGWG